MVLVKPFITLSLLILLLSSCANTSFECSDAQGLACMPMSVVEEKIKSGEIEEVERCKGKKCRKQYIESTPPLRLDPPQKAILTGEESEEIKKDLNVIYVK